MLSQSSSLYQNEAQFGNWQRAGYNNYTVTVSNRSNKENQYQVDTGAKYKYKTELCKNWEERGFCPYGNKCRFAHGINELNSKDKLNDKYKSKPCQSFFNNMFCHYGTRCLFKHDERTIKEISTVYYTILLKCPEVWTQIPKRRLSVFLEIANKGKNEIEEEDSIKE